MLLTCNPSAGLITFYFRSSGQASFLDLDPYRGTDPLDMFPLFIKRTANVLAPRLSVLFQRFVRLCSFRLDGDRSMSPKYRKIRRTLEVPITDRFP